MSGSPSRLKSELITDRAGIPAIEDEWRALAELRGNAFITPDWFQSWWDNTPDATSPVIVAARRADGSLTGVMPLAFDFARRPRMIGFAAAGFGDRFAPAALESDEDAVAVATMDALSRAQLDRYTLVFNNVEPDASWWREIQRVSVTERAGIVQQRAEQPYIRLAGLDWEGYLQSRSSSFRKKLRQRERKLQQGHEVAVRSATDATLDADLAHYFALHELRFQAKSTILSPSAREFLSAFAAAAQRRGWLRLRLLEVDGLPVAAFLGWRVGDTYAFYNSGFDPEWSDLSVGMVLLTRTVQSAIEEGAAEFDMLLGNEDYKRRFQNATREVQTVVMPKAMAPARILIAAEAGARTLGRRFTRRPGGKALRKLLPTSRGL